MDNLKILENVFKSEMKNKNFEEFKKTHPTLLSVILKAMKQKDEDLTEQRLVNNLYTGKVSEIIGLEKSIGLMSESRNQIKHALKQK